MPPGAGSGHDQRLRVLVRGRVQGVFFRQFVARHAQQMGLTGWVRNLPGGGTVEVVAEGPRQTLTELLALLGQGPPGARVEKTDAEWGAARSDSAFFYVR